MTGLLTAREVAEMIGLSTETVLRYVRRGDLPAIRLPGGALRFHQDELEAWLEERATPNRGVVEHHGGRRPAASVPLSLSSTTTTEE